MSPNIVNDEAANQIRRKYSKEAATSLTQKDIRHIIGIRNLMTPYEQLQLQAAVRRHVDPNYKWLCKTMSDETMKKINSYLEKKK